MGIGIVMYRFTVANIDLFLVCNCILEHQQPEKPPFMRHLHLPSVSVTFFPFSLLETTVTNKPVIFSLNAMY